MVSSWDNLLTYKIKMYNEVTCSNRIWVVRRSENVDKRSLTLNESDQHTVIFCNNPVARLLTLWYILRFLPHCRKLLESSIVSPKFCNSRIHSWINMNIFLERVSGAASSNSCFEQNLENKSESDFIWWNKENYRPKFFFAEKFWDHWYALSMINWIWLDEIAI